ncbi:MAG: type II toxin-antitoxin system Phd/YefM family antitoxin [Oscillospiraceae bacterium]|nr:type II toxin-antitoxin system Phd/YefM family antitoxin [Oscillospiraceae bacterium]MDD7428595.1 type II toxin-antitoxin system Phd/YefM family antitoxin [Oscillospiraceae bacterium]MDY2848317.1 type II toxin-antitoxin system Phd/YefM family antitoxin [Oscillospiraceae bacterium]
MMNTNVTNFRKNIYNVLENTIRYNEPVTICTKNGNAVIMSEDDYRGIMETLYLTSDPQMKKKLIDGMNTPVSECLSESEVQW